MTPNAQNLIEQIFAADRERDLDGFMALLTDDVRLRIGSTPFVDGKTAARRVIGALFAGVRRIEHRLQRGPFEEGDDVSYFGEVTFTRLDGKRVTLPYANSLRRAGDRFCVYDIHMDPSPLLAAPVAIGGLLLAATAAWIGYRLGRRE